MEDDLKLVQENKKIKRDECNNSNDSKSNNDDSDNDDEDKEED
jgi:hypothetical protein